MEREELDRFYNEKAACLSNIGRQLSELKKQIDEEDIDIGGMSYVFGNVTASIRHLGIKLADAVQEEKDRLDKIARDKKNAK